MKQMNILSVGKLTNLWCDQYAVGPEDNQDNLDNLDNSPMSFSGFFRISALPGAPGFNSGQNSNITQRISLLHISYSVLQEVICKQCLCSIGGNSFCAGTIRSAGSPSPQLPQHTHLTPLSRSSPSYLVMWCPACPWWCWCEVSVCPRGGGRVPARSCCELLCVLQRSGPPERSCINNTALLLPDAAFLAL